MFGQRHHRGIRRIPWIVLGLGLATTLLLAFQAERSLRASMAADLGIEVNTAAALLSDRWDVVAGAMRGFALGAGEFPDVSARPEWQAQVQRLATVDALPGIGAVGVVTLEAGAARLESVLPIVPLDERAAERVRSIVNLPELRAIAPGTKRVRVVFGRLEGVPPASAPFDGFLLATIPPGSERSAPAIVFAHFDAGQLVRAPLKRLARKGLYTLRPLTGPFEGEPVFVEAVMPPGGNALLARREVHLGDQPLLLTASVTPTAFTWSETSSLVLLAGLLASAGGFGVSLFGIGRFLGASRHHEAEEREAEQAAERFATLFNTAPDAIVGLDAFGRIVSFNIAAEQMFRVLASEAIGRPFSSLVPDMIFERVRATLDAGLETLDGRTRSARLQTQGERRGGMRFPVELNIGEVTGPWGATITCILRDMTDGRRTEEELRLYKRAITSSSNGIIISDITLPDQPVLYVNPAFERMTGYDLADVFGRNCRFLQGPGTDRAAIAKMRSAIARGSECQVTLVNYRKDGTLFWNHLSLSPVRDRNGRVTHYIGVQTDLTETKHIEYALEERRQHLDAIFSLSADGFASFSQDNRVTYANPSFARVTGIAARDLHSITIKELDERLAAMQDPNQPYRPLADVLESLGPRIGPADASGGAGRFQDVLHLRNPAPKVLARGVRLATGGATRFVLYLRDITRETEVDRMKSEFLSSAAHELRTPMASIYGFVELLLRRDYDGKTRRDLLETIHRQAKHLTSLVNELLDLARIEARAGKDFKIGDCAIAPLVRETVDSMLVPDDARVVRVDLPEVLPPVRMDAAKLKQAITNVLSNAYKYSPQGGELSLAVEVRSANDRDFVAIRVRDRGIGMTPEQVARACDRFYRADATGAIPGTGLGLSLVKEIMELQGGSIEIASELGKGTTVTLWLPVGAHQPARAA